MPYSFVQIEQEKSRTIQWSVAFLFVLYFVAALTIVGLTKAYFLAHTFTTADYGFSFWGDILNWPTIGWTLLGTSVVSLVHWSWSTNALIDNTLQMMSARVVDQSKNAEHMFKNVVDEAAVATGSKYQIEAWILPTSAMNAFALQDFQGRCVIGITEGLLMRLDREQLEAVVGHEAGHIAEGDCKETTVTMVLFKTFDNICDMGFNVLRFSGSGYGYSRSSDRRDRSGGILPLIVMVIVVAWVFKFISVLGSLFISREREYRADAVSAKLTRNPLALAEALYIISQRWKGSGIPGQAMDAIFIQSPCPREIEDQENFFADLFSTHPPVSKRISILLDMAHARPDVLDSALKKAQTRVEEDQPGPPAAGQAGQWMVFKDQKWQGPFNLTALQAMGLRPDTPVKKIGEPQAALEAHIDREVRGVLPAGGAVKKDQCPRCHVDLAPETYEGCRVLHCPRCDGQLVSETDVLTIIGKRETAFDERIAAMARLIRQQVKPLKSNPFDQIYDQNSIVCPNCLDVQKRMTRRFVSPIYPVEIDRCKSCGRIWFDKDELEVLQFLYEEDHPAQPAASTSTA